MDLNEERGGGYVRREIRAVRAGIDAVIIPRLCSAWSRSAIGRILQDTSSVLRVRGRRDRRAIATMHALCNGNNQQVLAYRFCFEKI
jgi:hypothetical protein